MACARVGTNDSWHHTCGVVMHTHTCACVRVRVCGRAPSCVGSPMPGAHHAALRFLTAGHCTACVLCNKTNQKRNSSFFVHAARWDIRRSEYVRRPHNAPAMTLFGVSLALVLQDVAWREVRGARGVALRGVSSFRGAAWRQLPTAACSCIRALAAPRLDMSGQRTLTFGQSSTSAELCVSPPPFTRLLRHRSPRQAGQFELHVVRSRVRPPEAPLGPAAPRNCTADCTARNVSIRASSLLQRLKPGGL